MNAYSRFLRGATAAAILAAAGVLLAAGPSRWKSPDNPIQLDFNADSPDCRMVMADDGQAFEITLKFQMIKHTEVSITADLPAPGRFQIEQRNAEALVDLKDVTTNGKQGTAKLVCRVPIMSEADAYRRAQESFNKTWDPVFNKYLAESRPLSKRQLLNYASMHALPLTDKHDADIEELRKLYAKDRAARKLTPEIRRGLTEVASRKPEWVSAKDKTRWAKIENVSLLDDYLNLLEHEIIADYLTGCKLGCETSNLNFKTKLDARLNAVNLIVSGKVAQASGELSGIAKGLGPQEVSALRNALTVQLRCRYYPEVDAADPNSQWFLGHRVACRASGVASIRLEGKLNPAAHDRADWWILEGYTPDSVTMDVPNKAAFRVEPPVACKGGAALHVVAVGEKATDYAVEFRPAGKTRGRLKVVIHESPNAPDTKFPY